MIKRILIPILIVFSLMLIVSCSGEEVEGKELSDVMNEILSGAEAEQTIGEIVEEVQEEMEETIEEELMVEEIEEESVECSVNNDCEWNEYCIDNICNQFSQIYDTESECDSKCNFNNVIVSTSDGEELTLSRGQGSYTGAGAVEWKLMSSADYCKGEEDTVVAIKLIKKNLGQILGEEVITVEVGEESSSIFHPTVNSIDFTLTVKSINEECS
jgi:hypothetical protein